MVHGCCRALPAWMVFALRVRTLCCWLACCHTFYSSAACAVHHYGLPALLRCLLRTASAFICGFMVLFRRAGSTSISRRVAAHIAAIATPSPSPRRTTATGYLSVPPHRTSPAASRELSCGYRVSIISMRTRAPLRRHRVMLAARLA